MYIMAIWWHSYRLHPVVACKPLSIWSQWSNIRGATASPSGSPLVRLRKLCCTLLHADSVLPFTITSSKGSSVAIIWGNLPSNTCPWSLDWNCKLFKILWPTNWKSDSMLILQYRFTVYFLEYFWHRALRRLVEWWDDVATQLQGWFFEVEQAVNATQLMSFWRGGVFTFLELGLRWRGSTFLALLRNIAGAGCSRSGQFGLHLQGFVYLGYSFLSSWWGWRPETQFHS